MNGRDDNDVKRHEAYNFIALLSSWFLFRLLERKVKQLMAERGDSQAYYYRPILTKYHRYVRDTYEKLDDTRGF